MEYVVPFAVGEPEVLTHQVRSVGTGVEVAAIGSSHSGVDIAS